MTMASISTSRKLSIMARIAAQRAQQSRWLTALMQAGRTTLGHIGRTLHHLWLEVTGFVFLMLGVIAASALVRELVKYHAGQAGLGRVILAICVTLLFGWFGLSSFWRVWKKS